MEQKALKLIMAGLLILSMALTGREAAEYVGAMHAVNALRETGMGADDSGRLCVVVDAGHGGDDPGAEAHRGGCRPVGGLGKQVGLRAGVPFRSFALALGGGGG